MSREYLTCTTPDCKAQYPASKRRITTLCKPCQARDVGASPEKIAKCRAKMQARFADPSYVRAHIERTTAGTRARMADPEFMTMRRELGRVCGLKHLGNVNRPAGSPSRLRAGQSRRATVLAWCPVEYRSEYQRLKTNSALRAPEARAIIEAQIQTDAARYARTGQLQSGNLHHSFKTGDQ